MNNIELPSEVEHAIYVARSTAQRSPAYARYLESHGVDIRTLQTAADFATLPITTKADYRNTSSLGDLIATPVDAVEVIAASAGSSGKPTFWPRGADTLEHCTMMFGHCLNDVARTRTRSTIAIITFPTGPYVGGLLATSALNKLKKRGHRITIATPGMDIEAVRDILTESGSLFEQVVIFAYPPVARDILDQCADLLQDVDVKLVVGGEPVTETWRERAHTMLGDPQGDRVRVVYGATDVGFVGYETSVTTSIRRAAATDPKINSAVFEQPEMASSLVKQPAFVKYDPNATYVEVDGEGYLLITVGGVLPLVRYRVNDRGDVLSGIEVRRRLAEADRQDLSEMVSPTDAFLLVRDRTDISAIFNAVNIYADYIRPAVEHVSLATRTTGRFLLRVVADKGERQTLQLVAELRDGTLADHETAEHLKQLTIASLRSMSAEYRVVHDDRGAAAEPDIELSPFRAGGFQNAALGKVRTIHR